MFRDGDFDTEAPLPSHPEDLVRDLELDTLLAAMARGDVFVHDVAYRALLTCLEDPEAIRYRQEVLADFLRDPDLVRALYEIGVAAAEERRHSFYGIFKDSPDANLSGAINVMRALLPLLRRLRALADGHGSECRSEGLRRFFAMLTSELDDEYLDTIEEHVENLDARRGTLLNARLGRVGRSVDYLVRRPRRGVPTWVSSVTRSAYSFQVAPRDLAGLRALTAMRNRGLNLVANALAQSADHVRSFFHMLRTEVAFYVGCINLSETLRVKGEPTCVPDPCGDGEPLLSATSLYDVGLALNLEDEVVGNDLAADGRSLVVITGANRGGKSTFLRALGVSQLMMQSGMFVPARSFRASVCRGVFTHFRRQEDASMEKGKLEEELSRMSDIADSIRPGAILLCNESFASTNEREGSEIARQVVGAMTEAGIRVCFVTHLHHLAGQIHARRPEDVLFLRAERLPDGRRTFRLREGAPLPTSFGEDLYRRIFGAATEPATAATATKTDGSPPA